MRDFLRKIATKGSLARKKLQDEQIYTLRVSEERNRSLHSSNKYAAHAPEYRLNVLTSEPTERTRLETKRT